MTDAAKPPSDGPERDMPSDAVVSAATSEHFVMQGAIGTAVSEQQARASMYLYSVSGALVAFGLFAGSPHLLLFVAAVLPVLFLVGLLTTLRLTDIMAESLQAFVTVARVRSFYRSLGPEPAALFDPAHGRWPEGKTDSGQVTGPVLGMMTTAASMIGCVNAFIGAAGIALLLIHALNMALLPAAAAGALVGVAQVVGLYYYQKRRIERVAEFARNAGLVIGDSRGPEASARQASRSS
jgi:hypothetical protein